MGAERKSIATMSDFHYDPATPSRTRTLLEEIGAAPNRTLGQNFLISGDVLDRIVATSGIGPEDQILEVGPGLGSLSCRLSRAAGRVVAIEKDPQFIDLLHRHLTDGNFHVIHGDALRIQWHDLELPDQNVHVVANLPYFISKPMLRRFMEEWRTHFSSLTILVQREVADRIVGLPGTSAYGPMSIMARLHGDARRVFDVKPGSFLPPPNVTSSVVNIQIRQTPRVEIHDEALFWRVITAAFGQRRKQLGNTLKSVVPDRDELSNTLHTLNIDPQRRGETLSLEEFAALANHLHESLQHTSTESPDPA
jgi:16S rRNA (adenine1518-N6/adenine1519-N6)-dimethyltransferase